MIKIKLNIVGDNPPFQYRIKGDEQWQSENIFEIPNIQSAVSYTFEVIDSTGCISEFTFSEEKLKLTSAGATSHTGNVTTRFTTNEPCQARIHWGVDPDNLDITDWQSTFKETHIIPFPVSFVGSIHYFKAEVRSKLGQTFITNALGLYFVDNEIELFNSELEVDATLSNLGNIESAQSDLFLEGQLNVNSMYDSTGGDFDLEVLDINLLNIETLSVEISINTQTTIINPVV